jgi:hypothetical protein
MTIPLVLVAGFSQSARHRLIRAALPARAVTGARIAWLDHQDTLIVADASDWQPTQSFVACVCCTGSLVFSTYLNRILRQGSWSALVVSLGARAEPRRMLELLSKSPWKEHLGPTRLFSVMDDTGLRLCDDPAHAMHDLALQQRDCAEQVLSPGQTLPPNLLF